MHVQRKGNCCGSNHIGTGYTVPSTVTPRGAGDVDGADRGGYPTTTGDDLAISGPVKVGGSWVGIKHKGEDKVISFQHMHSGGCDWEEGVYWRV